MGNDWTVAAIVAKGRSSKDGKVYEQQIAGWVDGLFGLDWRANACGDAAWIISHLPTGWGVMAVCGGLEDAKAVAEELRSATDWQFTDPDDAGGRKGDIIEWEKRTKFVELIDSPANYNIPFYWSVLAA